MVSKDPMSTGLVASSYKSLVFMNSQNIRERSIGRKAGDLASQKIKIQKITLELYF